MTIECTIRFKGSNAVASIARAIEVILTRTEAETEQFLIDGLYFISDRSPVAILAAFESDGFEFADFASIEFRPA